MGFDVSNTRVPVSGRSRPYFLDSCMWAWFWLTQVLELLVDKTTRITSTSRTRVPFRKNSDLSFFVTRYSVYLGACTEPCIDSSRQAAGSLF